MDLEADDLAVDAMMALIQGVYGELRNPIMLRAHVGVIIGASMDLGSDDMDAWQEADTKLRAYLVMSTDHPYDRS